IDSSFLKNNFISNDKVRMSDKDFFNREMCWAVAHTVDRKCNPYYGMDISDRKKYNIECNYTEMIYNSARKYGESHQDKMNELYSMYHSAMKEKESEREMEMDF
ncbi:MAG: hypothetical protein LUD48_00285, partial [Prevotella sp.]|nr:hypothetical protein [Prevotella sp.]